MSLPERPPLSLLQQLTQSTAWPVMPEAGMALIQSLADDRADTYAICRIIKRDPVLTATLLRMANSALFGLSGSVDTLERAVSVVGVSLIRSRALSLCLARICPFPVSIERMAFWRYSLLCASYAQWLADLCEVDDQQAWLGGLMLRLGAISLVQAQPALQYRIEDPALPPGERWPRQRDLIGFDEGQVIAELAQRWDFPAALVLGLRQTGQPLLGHPFSRLAGVLHLAGQLADSGPITPQTLDQLPVMVLTLLQLERPSLDDKPPTGVSLEDLALFFNS
jgi:HD-like signal output (HDOD) protein